MHIIVINGMPGVGKSTLAQKLTADLQLPLMAKDAIKEFLFDQLGSDTLEDSRFLGKVAVKMMYTWAAEYIANDHSILLENAFYAAFARPDLTRLIEGTNTVISEVYCVTNEAERHRRFSARIADGSRHAGHHDNLTMLEAAADIYAPLALGTVYRFDTTKDDPAAYAQLLADLRAAIQ